MSKRLIDDSITTSVSLASCSPRAQDAFHRFILMADDFGCFDAHPMVLKGRGWPLRPDVSAEDIAGFLRELAGAGMAQLWQEGDRTFCFLTGWFGPHGQRKREEYDAKERPHGSKRKTPVPPDPSDSRNLPRGPAVSAYAVTVSSTGTVTDTGSVSEKPSASLRSAAPRRKRRAETGEPGEVDPLHSPTLKRLVAAYEEVRQAKYPIHPKRGLGREAEAVTAMLAMSGRDADEIERRFRSGLMAQFRARIDTIYDLADPARWSANATTGPPIANGVKRPATQAAASHEAFGTGGEIEF